MSSSIRRGGIAPRPRPRKETRGDCAACVQGAREANPRAAMAAAPLHAGPSVRVSSRLQLATTFFPCSWHPDRGPKGGRDIALRRRPSRPLRDPEQVDHALAEDVLPLVRHKFDRGAVVGGTREICAHVSAACADQHLAHGGVHVLVLVDTFACAGTVLRRAAVQSPPLYKLMRMIGGAPMKSFAVTKKMGSGTMPPPAKKSSFGVIGGGRPNKPAADEERFKGYWLPW
ncbi:hypothetical protein QOZ80_3AG0246540 [Eleusine coracana subsp. coracana]|nr:hypothetical protein QOZ80_3AG0246540 [Eleusine coracana subsp. coracana]